MSITTTNTLPTYEQKQQATESWRAACEALCNVEGCDGGMHEPGVEPGPGRAALPRPSSIQEPSSWGCGLRIQKSSPLTC